jgi:hypothetical protein
MPVNDLTYHEPIPEVCEGCMTCFCCDKPYHIIWSAFWKPQYYKDPDFEIQRIKDRNA